MPKPLASLAEKILADTKKTFCFDSVNREPVSSHFKQLSFIFNEINELTSNDRLFKMKLKRKKLREYVQISDLRENYKKNGDLTVGLKILFAMYNYDQIKDRFTKKEKNSEWKEDYGIV